MAEALTQSALAEALGLSKGRVAQLKAEGMPVDSITSAQAWREARLNVAARKPSPPIQSESSAALPPPPAFPPISGGDFGDEDFQMARTRREIAEANLAEMREAELEGKLIRVEAIRAAWAKRISATRDALLQLPHRLAPVLAAETEMERVSQLLDVELRQALTELSRDAVAGKPREAA